MAPRTEAQARAQKKYRATEKGQAAQKRWNASRRERGISRVWRLKTMYGITESEIEEKLIEQSGVCAICGSANPGGRFGVFHVDHDHRTGRFRGLLCYSCNRGLGFMRDSPEILERAASYVSS